MYRKSFLNSILVLIIVIFVGKLQYLSAVRAISVNKQFTQPLNWETYTNDRYGYEVSYPANWKVITSRSETLQIFRNTSNSCEKKWGFCNIAIYIENNLSSLTLSQWVDIYSAPFSEKREIISEKESIYINGINGIKFLQSAPDSKTSFLIAIFGRDRFIYELITRQNSDLPIIFNQMLLTFKFIEPNIILPSEAEKIIENRARETILTIKNRDFDKLSSYVHPENGVRFSPYSFVNKKKDLIFSAEKLPNILADTTKYIWGVYDGSGLPMELTFEEYFERFVYAHDFVKAKEIGYNQIIGVGNTINNNFEVYPNSIIVEYYFPGFDPKYEGMDWVSLRLVFEEKEGVWYLVGIVHDSWTI